MGQCLTECVPRGTGRLSEDSVLTAPFTLSGMGYARPLKIAGHNTTKGEPGSDNKQP